MERTDDRPGPESDRIVEREETYEHAEHGTVEVTGIWRGIDQVDTARNTETKDVIIVRYSATQDGEPVDELTETVDEFTDNIE